LVTLLADEELSLFLSDHPGWERGDNDIVRVFTFNDFVEAMGFVTKTALVAEKAFHHPHLDIRWNRVTVRLSTHSEGGITEKDIELAAQLDAVS
jgi:4a-hydroxytetrahydrobiopterin dehydratase